jgi:branched-chain amino acid transport system ATP-binding protein
MLSIAGARVTNPHILLLDEPLEGLAPGLVAEVEACIRRIVGASRASLVIAEQHFEFAAGIAADAIVLEHGRMVHSAELAVKTALVERYIGLREHH